MEILQVSVAVLMAVFYFSLLFGGIFYVSDKYKITVRRVIVGTACVIIILLTLPPAHKIHTHIVNWYAKIWDIKK